MFYCICSFDLRSLYLDYPATAAIDFTPYLKFDQRFVLVIFLSCNSKSICKCRFVWRLIVKSLKCSGWHLFNGITQFYLPPTCLSTCGMNHLALLPGCRASPPIWSVLFPYPAKGRRLRWPGWLGKDIRVVCLPKTVTCPSTSWAQCMATLLMRQTMLTVLPSHHHALLLPC